MTCTEPETTLPGVGESIKMLIGKGVFTGPCVGTKAIGGGVDVGRLVGIGSDVGALSPGFGVNVGTAVLLISVGTLMSSISLSSPPDKLQADKANTAKQDNSMSIILRNWCCMT